MKNHFYKDIAKYVLIYSGIVALSLLLEYLITHVGLIKAFDNYFYVKINSLPHTPLTEMIVYPVNLWFFPLSYIFILPAFFYFILGGFFLYLRFFKRPLLIWGVLAIIIGLVLAGILLEIDWHFIFRHRPFEFLPSNVDSISRKILMKVPSYPSGHVRDTTLVCTIIFYFVPRLKWLLVIFVMFIAFTRVYEGAHYPTDVLAGILFGFLIGKLTLKMLLVWKTSRIKEKGAKLPLNYENNLK